MATLRGAARAPVTDAAHSAWCAAPGAALKCGRFRPCHQKGSETPVFILVPRSQLKHNALSHIFFSVDCLIVRLWAIIKPSLLSYFFLAGYRKVNSGLAPGAF